MCNPALVMGAMMVAGAAAQKKASNSQDKARAEAMRLERERQEGFKNESEGEFNKALEQYEEDKYNASLDQAAAEKDERFVQVMEGVEPADVMSKPAGGGNVSDSTNNVIRDRILEGLGDAKSRAGAAAKFGSFGDLNRTNQRGLNDAASNQGMYNSFAYGSANALTPELMAANQKGTGWQTLGQLLGMGASMYGANQAYQNPHTPQQTQTGA